jgi:uncharacterized protein (DUF488 family)
MTLYTIGFTKKSAEQFFGLLMDAGVSRLVDVRLNNMSQLAGFTRKDDLRYFLREVGGIDYIHMQGLAPEAQMLKDYRAKALSWDEYSDLYTELLRSRRVEDREIASLRDGDCLLCSEAEPEYCHRRLAAEYAQKVRPELGITHLHI